VKIRRRVGDRARTAVEPRTPPTRGSDDLPPGPGAVYARILDGDNLWLAVIGTERAGLRAEGSGTVFEPASDAPPDPSVTSLRWHLPSALPEPTGDEPELFEVVTVPAGDPVRAHRLPDPAPMRTPPSRDGRWQFEVRRREGGALVVRREPRGEVAEVADTVLTPDGGLALTFTAPGLADPRLLVVDAEGTPVSEIPAAREGDLWTATVRADDVPSEEGPHWLIDVADGDRRVRLVRPRNDSLMPGHSTVLPFLWTGDGEDRSMVRFQYQREGRVRVNRPPAEEGDGA
jgi:hypothetical protein